MTKDTPSTSRHQVLIIDDDAQFLEMVSVLFEAYSQGTWQTHGAANAEAALAILDQKPMDLLVIDVQMPVVDGMQFLHMVHRRFPGMAKVVFTGYGTEDLRAWSLDHGADLYLEKPRTPEGFVNVFANLQELVNWKPQEEVPNPQHQVGLAEILQLECRAKKSSIFHLTSDHLQGRIYIKEGAIIHAEAGQEMGEAAFYRLFCLPTYDFRVDPFQEPAQPSIDANWEFLLMEASRQRDQEARDSIRLTPSGCPEPGSQTADGVVEPELAGVLEAYESDRAAEPRRIDEVIVCSGRDEVLYSWQCEDIESRMKLVRLLEQKAELFVQRWPLGLMDRIEIEGPSGRVVAQFQPGRKLWVRSNPLDAPEVT